MGGYNRISPTPGVDWWDKQPGESATAFSRFVTYREQPPGARSLQKVAESVRVKPGTIRNQASAYRWRDRAAAFDAHQAEQRRTHIEEQHGKLAKALADQALAATAVLGRSIRALFDSGATLPPDQLPRWASMIDTMQRAATSGPDATLQVTGPEGGPVLVEFDGLTPSEAERRAREMAEGVLRVFEGGKKSA